MADQEEKKQTFCCPYCEGELKEAGLPFCQSCDIAILYCPKCQKPLPRESNVCPDCGAELMG